MRTVVFVGLTCIADAVTWGQFHQPRDVVALQAFVFIGAVIMDVVEFLQTL